MQFKQDNEANHLIIYCLNCIRHGRNVTYEHDLSPAVFYQYIREHSFFRRGGGGSIPFLEGEWAGGIQGRVINFLPVQKGGGGGSA